MKNIPPPIPVADENDFHEASERNATISDGSAMPPPPDVLRSFVYREPTGLHTDDDDEHPRRRRSDRVPRK